jgi:hypothetical protein
LSIPTLTLPPAYWQAGIKEGGNNLLISREIFIPTVLSVCKVQAPWGRGLGEGYFRDKDIGRMVKKEKNGFETKKEVTYRVT